MKNKLSKLMLALALLFVTKLPCFMALPGSYLQQFCMFISDWHLNHDTSPSHVIRALEQESSGSSSACSQRVSLFWRLMLVEPVRDIAAKFSQAHCASGSKTVPIACDGREQREQQ